MPIYRNIQQIKPNRPTSPCRQNQQSRRHASSVMDGGRMAPQNQQGMPQQMMTRQYASAEQHDINAPTRPSTQHAMPFIPGVQPGVPIDCQRLPLAMAWFSFQQYESVYNPEDAMKRGTLFPELDKPFMAQRRAIQ